MPYVRVSLLLLLCLALGTSQVLAQKTNPSLSLMSELPFNPNVKTGTLENGLRWFILKNGKPEQRAELRLAVNVGSILETDEQQGLAHFCEHMAFNGTKHFEKDALVKYLESIGTRFGPELNAYTGFDETVYLLKVPTDKPDLLEKGFLILEDWAHNVSYDSTEIDKERGVILEELRLGKGASKRIQDKQFPIIFKNSHYAERLPIGKENILKNFAHGTLTDFYKRWYRPDLMAVIAVGDFDVDDIEKKIRAHFSQLRKPDTPSDRQLFPVPNHTETYYTIVSDPEASSATITLYYKHETKVEKRIMDYRAWMVRELYSKMFNERLEELTLLADPPFIYADGDYSGFVRTKDAYFLSATVKNDGIERGLDVLMTEAARVRKHGFTETELDRAKTNMLREMETMYNEREKTESDGYADELVRYFLDQEPAPGIETEYEIHKKYLPTVMLAEVNKLATEFTTEKNRVVALSMPEKKDVTVPTQEQLVKIITDVDAKAVEAYVDKVSQKPLVEIPKTHATVMSERVLDNLGVTEWTLSNGIRVLVKPTEFKADEVKFSATSPGGLSLIRTDDLLSGAVATSVVSMSGIGEFDATQLRKALTGKVANATPIIGGLTEGFQGEAAPKDLEILLQLVYLYATAPRRDTSAYQSFRMRMKGFLENFGAMPEMVFQDSLSVTMANYHPRRPSINVASLDKLDYDKMTSVYADRFADFSDFTFFFVGNVQLDALKPMVETWLGALPVTRRKETWKDEGIEAPKDIVEKTIVKGIEQKGRVHLSFTGDFEYTFQNRYAISSLEELLDIKLREELREEKGGTYGVSIDASVSKYPTSKFTMNISFGCDPARIAELEATMFTVLKSISELGASKEDVEKIQELQRRERETQIKENDFWLRQLESAVENNDNPAEFLNYNSAINGLTSDIIQQAAQTYLNMKRYVKMELVPEKSAHEKK